MNRKQWLSKSILLFLLLSIAISTMAAMDASLLEMSEQMDGIDKQDFQSAIDKASACTHARNFPCAESELAKAAKAANSGQDKKSLLAGRNSLANEKQQLALEIRRAEEERQARIRREEEERVAQRKRDEEREAREWSEKRDAQAAEDRRSLNEYKAALWGNLQNNINRSWAQAEAGSRGSSIEEDRAKAKRLSDFNDSISRMEADPNSDLNRDKRARERERERDRAEAKRADSVRAAKLEAAKKVELASEAKRSTEKSAQADAAAKARKKQEAAELKAQQEQEKQRLEVERRSQELRDIAERKRVAAAEEAKQKAEKERQAQAEKQVAADQNKATDALLKSKWGGPKKIVKLYEPCGEGKTEAEARFNSGIGWQNFKRGIEYTHERGMSYGIILSTGETTCMTKSRFTTGRDLGGDWMCRVAYTKEVLDSGGDRPAKGISR